MIYHLLIGDKDAPDFDFPARVYKNGSISLTTALDVIGSELAVDELSIIVDYESGAHVLFSPADYDGVMSSDGWLIAAADQAADLSAVERGTPVWLTEQSYDGAASIIFTKMYLREIVQLGTTTYRINAMSAIGFLEDEKHMGGMYNGMSVEDVLEDIIGDRFDYSIDGVVAQQKVYSWLPIDTRRNNLHKLMFALGISLVKDADGNIVFIFIEQADSISIPADKIYPDTQLSYDSPVTGISVMEHSYYKLAGTEQKQLLDNTSGSSAAAGLLVEFDAPYCDLRADGLTIDDSGVNYAVVSGIGTLYGVPYHHETRTIYKEIPSNANEKKNIVSITDDTLINSLNSESVANRLLSYYSNRMTTTMSVVTGAERAGSTVTFVDETGQTSVGMITRADYVISSFPKGTLKIIHNYIPTGQGNWFAGKQTFTASAQAQVFTAAETGLYRFVLIGSGQGGQGGNNGEHGLGENDMYYTHSDYRKAKGYESGTGDEAGAGGAGGQGGAAGKVLMFEATLTAGDTVTLNIPFGGAAGAAGGGTGQAGSATTAECSGIFVKSSADGNVLANGYLEILSGDVYAAPGVDGIAGGDGGATIDRSALAGDGLTGSSVITNVGGEGGSGLVDNQYSLTVAGGGGGGAAVGVNGGQGGNGTSTTDPYTGAHVAVGGTGGNGANASAPSKPAYGCGGAGGNGGGGGGNGGGCDVRQTVWNFSVTGGGRGAGGAGSAGSDGGDGIVIIYH